MANLPVIIQGGMGVGVSSWRLARAVSSQGQLGVVSGTALDQVLARRLQDGDPGGHMRRGLEAFPVPDMAERVWDAHYIAGGKPERTPYVKLPMPSLDAPRHLTELCVVANFVEVHLARQGHGHPVGINYLEKLQPPHLPSLYGAMLAGVEYVLMGAGIPMKIPGALDALARHEPASYPLQVTGAEAGAAHLLRLVPRDLVPCDLPDLRRPMFLPIVASATLATTLLRKANGRVDGFVVEGYTAGGHNAPPRGKLQLSADGEPIYGERDQVDPDAFREMGVPFWRAGGYGTREGLRDALAQGATGVQVGTAFALCAESGLRDDFKRAIRAKAARLEVRVVTDARASPTGFPFKVVQLEGTMSEAAEYVARPRICDLGYLRDAYATPEGTVGYRCASEPVSTFVAKGGKVEDTVGRKCICNALMATVGHPQIRAGRHLEPGVVTSGDALVHLVDASASNGRPHTAADVIRSLLDESI